MDQRIPAALLCSIITVYIVPQPAAQNIELKRIELKNYTFLTIFVVDTQH